MVTVVNWGVLSTVVFNKNQAIFLKYIDTLCDQYRNLKS